MITRFRFECAAPTKERTIEILDQVTTSCIAMCERLYGLKGEWECTDDVVSLNPKGGYKGRRVMTLESEMREEFSFGSQAKLRSS